MFIQKRIVKTALHVFTVAADVLPMLIISRETSKVIMQSDASSRESVWSALS